MIKKRNIKASLPWLIGVILLLLVIAAAAINMTGGSTPGNTQTALEKQEEAKQPELNTAVVSNRADELVFKFSLADFIAAYNTLYRQEHDTDYLQPAAKWSRAVYDYTPHSEHQTCYFLFTEDKKAWPLPTIGVYVPVNSDYVQAITINFDDHSFSEKMYDLYGEMCFYTLKAVFPEFSDAAITDLYTMLNKLADDNAATVPYFESTPYVVYYKNNIGVYPYFALGERLHLCVIPVTQEYLAKLAANGAAVNELSGS